MRIYLALILFFLMHPVHAACNSALLDQNFRKLAGTEMVNLCEAYSGKVLLVAWLARRPAAT